jgi:hypothetical protein
MRGEELAASVAAPEFAGQAALERPVQQAAAIAELGWVTADGRVLKPKNAADAVDLYRLRSERRRGRIYSLDEPLDRIGALTSHRHGTTELPLAAEQSTALTKLDRLVREVRDMRWLADADVPAEDLASYEAYLQRSFQRHSATIGHAQRMVMTGLLTEPQAAFVWQRWLRGRQTFSNSMYDEHLRDLLRLTAEQRREIEHIAEKYRDEFVTPSIWEVLTEQQQATFSQMKAERTLPAEAPDLPSLEALAKDGATVDLAEVSPVIRALNVPQGTPFEIAMHKPPVILTAHQRRLVADLGEMTQLGWLWIGLRNSDPNIDNPTGAATDATPDTVDEARRAFMKAAEQVALVGILSEEQAMRLAAAVAGR